MFNRTIVRWTLALGALAALWPAASACAGQIDPGLQARMNAAGADELIQVVIRPVGTLSGAALKKQVASQYATLAEQHAAAVNALRATADAVQPAILRAMNAPEFDGRVYDAQGFWIDNVITARMTASAIAELAQRPDIEEVVEMPLVRLVTPVPADATDVTDNQSVTHGLRAIKADSVWAMGYTGSGRLIASMDTGVDGDHFVLASKWRGNNGYSVRESWFDPVYNDPKPRVYSGSGLTHGTLVMGLLVGVISQINDTIGVCPDCQWISAAAIDIPCPTNINIGCGNLFEAMQWLADPDGNPLTTDDVPDAVANPWGAFTKDPGDGCVPTGIGCSNIFWNAIDNIEAAGPVMVFAAGNEGSCGASTIRNPGNRNTSSTNSFSVGMVDSRTDIINPPVDPLSSKGPSDCDNSTIKPELVAPGVSLRSTTPGGNFSNTAAYGTSFSTPLVAGAVALLREYNPNATAEQIKQALLAGAKDLGPAGPDNSYGNGLLDIAAALRALPANAQPNISVQKDYYIRPAAGQSAQVVLRLKNAGAAATGVNVTITSNDSRLTIQDRAAAFANMPNAGDTAANHDDPFDVTVSLADVVSGERLPITVNITAAGGYARTYQAAIQTGPVRALDLYTHDAGNVQMTISSFGGFGLQADNLNPRKGETDYGVGFLYGGDATQSLFEGGFLVATGPTKVSDAVRNSSGSPDIDFMVDPGGRVAVSEPGETYAEETRAGFSDAYAENPIGVFVEQRTWASDNPDEDDYIVCEYTIWNRSGQTLNNLRAGLYFDWDFPFSGQTVATRDGGGFNAQLGLGWMRHRDENRFRGLCVISPTGTSSYHYFDNLTEIFDFDGLSENDKWLAMSGGFGQTVPPAEGDGSHLIAAGPFTIPADSAVRVAFAVIGATSEQALLASAQAAKDGYSAGTVSVSPVVLQFSAPVGGPDPNPQTVTITNNTDQSVTFGVLEVPAFAIVDPSVGEIAAGEDVQLTVRPSVGDRTAGVYRDTLAITTSDPLLPLVRIQVTLSVGSGGVSVNPNPFSPAANGSVTLTLAKPATGKTTAAIYDLGGRLVHDFGAVSAGNTVLIWDGKSEDGDEVADGVYFCYVEAGGEGGFKQTLKIAVKKKID
ncbi:MAG TPA: S8 family serine peptidase [bacterium]|nr:S8 family serine peptidase [bacterium]